MLTRRPSRRISSSGRRADECRLAAADRVDEAAAEGLAQDAEDRGDVVFARRSYVDLACEHDLLEPARRDQLDRAGNRGLVVLGRDGASDQRALRRMRVEQRQRSLDERCEPLLDQPLEPVGAVAGTRERRNRAPELLAAASNRDLGARRAMPRGKADHCSALAPSSAKAKPPAAISPPPGGPGGGSAQAFAASVRQRAAARWKRLGPRSSIVIAAPSTGQRRAVALGLLEADPRLARAARGEDDRARIDPPADSPADGREALTAPTAVVHRGGERRA